MPQLETCGIPQVSGRRSVTGSTPQVSTPRGRGPGDLRVSSFPGDSDARAGLTTEDSFQPSCCLVHFSTSFRSRRLPVPATKGAEGKKEGRRRRSHRSRQTPGLPRQPRRPAPAPGLHNGPRGAFSRGFHRPLLAPRQRESGGAANMAERRRHKKRIQVAKPSFGAGGFRELGSRRSGGSPLERRAKLTARWGEVLSLGRGLPGEGPE